MENSNAKSALDAVYQAAALYLGGLPINPQTKVERDAIKAGLALLDDYTFARDAILRHRVSQAIEDSFRL